MRQRAAEAITLAEAERVRQEARQARSQPRRPATPPAAGVRQDQVVQAALTHHEKHGHLPSESELVKQTGASRSTVTRALG